VVTRILWQNYLPELIGTAVLTGVGMSFVILDSRAGSRARPVFKTGYTKFAEACSGFTTVSLQADHMNVGMIDYRGRLLYTANIPRAIV